MMTSLVERQSLGTEITRSELGMATAGKEGARYERVASRLARSFFAISSHTPLLLEPANDHLPFNVECH